MGGAQSPGDLVSHRGSDRRSIGKERIKREGFSCDWDYEPARDDGCLGKGDRKASNERDRLAGHACGRSCREIRRGRRARPVSRKDWVAAEYLFQRAEAPLDFEECGWGGKARCGRRIAFWKY